MSTDGKRDDLLPRPERRPRRARADRGLPFDEELANLARAYLERQSKHWPEMVEAELLPEATEEAIGQMVEDFKDRHRSGKVDPNTVRVFLKLASKLGGSYNRFSCDNSSPLSVVDQLVNSLDKARSEDRFVPWAYVFADYSVTGLDPSRQGYSSCKAVLRDKANFIETIYIDDFSRASRDELEWWKLAALSKRLRKRMIGASDSFDLHSDDADMKIGFYGLFSRLFIKQLRQKVRRGMKGAARRGTCLGKLGLGFTRQVCCDANGEIIRRPDGQPRHKPAIDPQTKQYRVLMYELYVHKNWSPYKIAKHFNQLRVDGSNGWTGSAIKKLLAGLDSIGVFVWNRKRREYDYEQEKYVTIANPRSEWEVYKDPSLALVPKELWRAAWIKLVKTRKAHPLTGKKWSRNQTSSTTLFSGTLFCEHCERELTLNRSHGEYKVMFCLNGSTGVRDCPLTTSKSTRIIEDCLLGYIRDSVFTEGVIADVIKRANVFLQQEASKPSIEVGPMKATLRDYQKRVKKLVKKVEKEPDDDLCEAYHSRIKELQKKINELKAAIRQADQQNRKKDIKPLKLDQAMAYLADLRGLLNQEIPMAAEAIRTLTGPIKIRQEKTPGRRGARWIATFSPDLLRLLRYVAKQNGDPDVALLDVIPSDAEPVQLVIEKVPKYERLAPEFKRMRDNGASVQSIATAHGMSWQYASEILHFADTGERPKWKAGERPKAERKRIKYVEIAKEVAQLREQQKMSFPKIAARFGVAEGTARRAYEHARPGTFRKAAKSGGSPTRGPRPNLDEDTIRKIHELIRSGAKARGIAKEVGCATSTVYRVRSRMQDTTSEERAA